MRATRSRIITSLLAAVGAGFAVSAMIGAPAAVAQPDIACEPGQVVIDGQCNVPDNNANNGSAPPGKVMCTQGYSCAYFGPDAPQS